MKESLSLVRDFARARREAAGAPFFPTRRLGRGAGPTAASARGTSARAFSMGSDNPKGAVAPLSAPARYGRYAAIACVCVVLVVTLLTNPHIDPKRVSVAGAGPRRAGASEGRQGALASMQGVASAVGDLKSKLKNAAVELGDVGALHETTMPRRRPGMPQRAKNAARVLERANYEEVGAKVAFTEKEVSEVVSREKKTPRGDSAAAGAGIPLEDLAKKVGETYARCGFDYDPTMSTVQMLTQIESKLERCLAVADEMPAAYVRESEKAREKERRAKQRTEKAAIDLAAAEEKAKRSLERSMSQVAKKVGKPLMTRSQPPSRKKKVVKEQLTEEEAELRAFLATDF